MTEIDLTDGPIRLMVHRSPAGAEAEPDAAQILAPQLILGRLTGFSLFNDWPLGKPLS